MLRHLKDFIRFTKIFGIYSKAQMTILVIGGVLMGVLELAGLSVLLPLLNLILQPDYMYQSDLIRKLSAVTHIETPASMAMMIGFVVALLFIIKNTFQIFYLRYEFSVLTRWRTHITSKLYRIYMNADYEIFMHRSSGQMINMISGMVPFVIDNYINKILSLMNFALVGTVILSYVIFVNWVICLTIFLVGLFMLKVYSSLFKEKSKTLGTVSQDLTAQQYSVLQQSFAGYKETRSHLKEDFFARNFYKTSNNLAKVAGKMKFMESLPPATVELVIMFLLIMTFEAIVLTGSDVGAASAQVGAIVLACLRMIPVINRSINCVLLINASHEPLNELLDEAVKFSKEFQNQDSENTSRTEIDIQPMVFLKELRLDNVLYSYPESEKSILNGLSFVAKPGEFIGITGPSGAGKSTLMNILLGFLTGYQGHYTVDGVPVTPGNIKSLRKILGFVDQQIFVIDGTIAENVAYGVEKSDIDSARVIKALERAQLWDFAAQLPNTINESVGENGKLLSGGQRQRLGIARALYRDLKILILDEASASLDVETEQKLSQFLNSLKGDVTVIMIAHRLSTLRHCERVIFLDGGRVADEGSFEHLYEKNEKFRNYILYSQIGSSNAVS